ncbi:MAG: hypothetical protein AB4063_23905 [Crocosphaera sp.]
MLAVLGVTVSKGVEIIFSLCYATEIIVKLLDIWHYQSTPFSVDLLDRNICNTLEKALLKAQD